MPTEQGITDTVGAGDVDMGQLVDNAGHPARIARPIVPCSSSPFKKRDDGARTGMGERLVWTIVGTNVPHGLAEEWTKAPNENVAFVSSATSQLMWVWDTGASEDYMPCFQAKTERLVRVRADCRRT